MGSNHKYSKTGNKNRNYKMNRICKLVVSIVILILYKDLRWFHRFMKIWKKNILLI